MNTASVNLYNNYDTGNLLVNYGYKETLLAYVCFCTKKEIKCLKTVKYT